MKPVVVVTGPDKLLRFGWWGTRIMLYLVGLKGHYVRPGRPELPDNVRGVIIGGGSDIDPEHYGFDGFHTAKTDPQRDALEMDVARRAIESGVPVFGICRGMQLINVVLGGTLFTNIRSKRKKTPNRGSIFPIKWVSVKSESRMRAILGVEKTRVNSLHYQAIDIAAASLRVTARDDDGFVQAIEAKGEKKVMGVQWHPEYMPYSKVQRRLFETFAGAVRETSAVLKRNMASGRS
ncbi:MAG: gamma-glutamyl-gamma-aminobutyrate hydrolase family protein [bacterium]